MVRVHRPANRHVQDEGWLMADFVHLHVHTHYSLLDSTVKVPSLIKRVHALGMDAVALTDHAVMFGCIELQKVCASHAKDLKERREAAEEQAPSGDNAPKTLTNGSAPPIDISRALRASAHPARGEAVRPIFGVQVYVVPSLGGEVSGSLRPCHLVLLAETLMGYRNLVRLVSRAHLRGLDGRGRAVCDHADLRELADGVIALTGDLGGEIPQHILRGAHDAAEATLATYKEIFGDENVFLELQRHENIPEQSEVCEALVALAQRTQTAYVATNNVHYLNEGDHEAHAALMCIGMEKRIDRDVIAKIPLTSLYLKSPEEMEELFDDLPLAILNTRKIADRCRVEIPIGETYLPRFPVPEGYDEAGFMCHLSREGLQERLKRYARIGVEIDTGEYADRLESELKTIERMGFPGYFLIVQDFINWAKARDIPVGPGRGSGAGSLVAYALGITDIDPLPFGLLFERFLNPERVSMPDFDIDFCQNRRGEVIEYVAEKYGRSNVAMIVTFGQLKARAVIRDVARVLNLSVADGDRLAKLIPAELDITLAKAYKGEPRLQEAVASDPTVAYLWKLATALEGNNRNSGIHAAGVVIAEQPVWEYVPVVLGTSGELVSQYAKTEVEDAGLIKFDFLGLKTLTVIDDAVRLVNQGRPADEQLDFDLEPLENNRVYDTIKSGDTTGIFQLESDGFQRLIRQLRPDCFADIVAAVALYRPGPLGSGMVDQFIDCKHGRREVVYPHPKLATVLAETYGVMVYQEQVMQVAQILAGYSLGQADILRRAMGKKKQSEMDKQRESFVKGAKSLEVPATKANQIFDLMAHFAGYGFNKSHSAAYALLTFRTAYLKTFHPTEFYAALMTNDASSTDKVVRYIVDARSRGIRVLPPDVNVSNESFSVDGDAIRFGLGAVKGLGRGPIEAIVEARAEAPFTSLYDFCDRVDGKRCTKRTLEALIRCGAFDALYPEATEVPAPTLTHIGRWRARLLATLDAAYERGQKSQRDREHGQSSLFGIFAEASPVQAPDYAYATDVRSWDPRTVLTAERETIGFYISGHPLDRYRSEIKRFSDADTRTLARLENRAEVRLAGVVATVRERPLKSGDGRMAFVQIEDVFGEVEGIVYSRNFDEVAPLLSSDEPLLFRGTIRQDSFEDENVAKVVIDSVQPLSTLRTNTVRRATIAIEASDADKALLAWLFDLLTRHPGECTPVLLVRFGLADTTYELPPTMRFSPCDSLIDELVDRLGDDALVFA